MDEHNVKILGIESSCDDTCAAVLSGTVLLSNVVAGQQVHHDYGGVVPELASRAHQQNIVPVVDAALKKAGIRKEEIDAIALTKGPGLMGSLLVGVSFAKALSMGLNKPLIEVNHMQGHILSHFIQTPGELYDPPSFPFLCLTVSGGHTQIVLVKDYFDMQILGQTLDDAAGEAFDKAAKIMALPYPGGPLIDKFAVGGNPHTFSFPMPHVAGLDFSFSGLKTSFLYLVRDGKISNSNFVEEHKKDLCASYQYRVVSVLMDKITKAAIQTGVKQIAIAGGVAANSGLRKALADAADNHNWKIYIPKMQYCTDNAAMIAITGHYKYLRKEFAGYDLIPKARFEFSK
ncbi:MAG TPA: tRNA (adenosine(37)-N6)-threonylcarbamoyltransferase complex transferase subunit TsaD [Bacteroidia bacterium]|jgi:N6-L-threonylcarbamoyladenine synthase|nr:tRNA (adenosine(37)-N6)-threonylcarbamoyltransferase complex transferase subunit TsaD [Bacteroidia bacterium]